MGTLKEKIIEVHGKESEEGNHKHTSVSVPLSFRKNGDSDREEPEEDRQEEPEEDLEMELEESLEEQTEDELVEGSEVESEDDQEEDPEEEPEEDLETELEESPEEQTEEELVEGSEVELEDDQEEDSSEEQAEKLAVECATPSKSCNEIFSAEHEDEDPSECVSEPDPEGETELTYQNSSDGKQWIVVNAAVKPSLSQNYSVENNCEYDNAVKQADTSQHSVPGGLEAVVGDTNSGQQANSGKRRRSRWDQDPADDKKTVIEDKNGKKRKSRWDADDSKLRLQEPQLDLEVQALKNRFSEISCILHPRVDTNVGRKFRKKLMKEHKKILSKLEERNAIFCKELYVPVKEYPTYNFFGIIIGPKGNTQKRMEMESGAKIRLRGKGSLKTAQGSDNKDLRVYIEASSQKSLDAAVCMVEKLLIPVEEGMNDHKRAQLQELGNLKAAGIISACSVCKETGHNDFVCPQKRSTLKAACDTCGSFSHPTSGCPETPSKLKIKSSREISAAKLYVGSLPQTIDDSRLRELFSPFGTITESRVVIDLITGKSKGYGFVGFDTPTAASFAIMHMHGYQMDGRSLAVKIAGPPPTTASPATSLLPVYPIPGPAAVGISWRAFPHSMLPEAQVSVLNGEGSGFPSPLNLEYNNQFSQTRAPVIPQRVSVSTGSRTAFSSTGFVSRSTESRSAFSSTSFVSEFPGNPDYPGLVSGSTESRTGFSSAGLVSGFTESRSAFPSTSFVSKFPGNPDYPGLVSGSSESRTAFLSAGFVSGSSDLRSALSSSSLVSKFPGDPDYHGSGFQSYFL